MNNQTVMCSMLLVQILLRMIHLLIKTISTPQQQQQQQQQQQKVKIENKIKTKE